MAVDEYLVFASYPQIENGDPLVIVWIFLI